MKNELENYLVEKYPKIFVDCNKGPKESLMCFGFEHDDGWFWILDQLCESMQNYIDSNNKYSLLDTQIEQVIAIQVKEKFGTLNFYYTGGDDIIYGMVSFAENLSNVICEVCGTKRKVGKTSGWVVTCCEKCHGKNKRLSNLQWKENEGIPLMLLRKIKLNNLKN